VRDSRRLEPPQQAQPEERGTGATRQLTAGIAGRCGSWGNPTNHQPTSRGRRNFGATRRFNLGKSRKMQSTGRPGDSSRVGDLKGEDSGQPGKSTPEPMKDAKFGAHRRSHHRQKPEDIRTRRLERMLKSSTGTANVRGNPGF
jgi:hypothetical protein